MLSTSILISCSKLVQEHCLPRVPKVWRCQIRFGLTALALRPLVSLNANARMAIGHRGTAETKMARLLHNSGLPEALGRVVASLGLVKSTSFVNIDHSDFNGLVALVGAVQTRTGRALPVFLTTAYSSKLPAHADASKRIQSMRRAYQAQEQKLTAQTISGLKAMHKQLGFWPKLVFDRGFGGKDIIGFLRRQKVTFYIRVKAGRLAELAGEQTTLSALPAEDSIVTIAGRRLRVIRSRKTGRHKEPWYILTSDLTSSVERIIKIYYHRFEIEETFRDIKSLLGLRRTKLQKPLSLAVLLWFISLGILLLYLAGLASMGKRKLIQLLQAGPAKKRLSWYRVLFELLERVSRQPLYTMITGGS